MREDIENRRLVKVKLGSSFCIPLGFYNKQTNTLEDVEEFKYIYKDIVGHEYEVSRKYIKNNNGEQELQYQNCFIKDDKLFAKFENYPLIKGRLTRDFYLNIPFQEETGDGFIDDTMKFIRTEQSIICLI
jgi:hypothetical protein